MFGRVTAGMDVVKKIQASKTGAAGRRLPHRDARSADQDHQRLSKVANRNRPTCVSHLDLLHICWYRPSGARSHSEEVDADHEVVGVVKDVRHYGVRSGRVAAARHTCQPIRPRRPVRSWSAARSPPPMSSGSSVRNCTTSATPCCSSACARSRPTWPILSPPSGWSDCSRSPSRSSRSRSPRWGCTASCRTA